MPRADEKPITILIIDDSADSRYLYGKALELENYRVLSASDGVEAFEVLKEEHCPEIILVDLTMPNMDGPEFIAKLRSHPKCASSKVLIVSGWDNLKSRARDLGADGFLRKPVDIAALYTEIENQLK